MRNYLLELISHGALIAFGFFFAWQFSITAWKGMVIWENRPVAILEAIVALGLVILGVERLIRDLRKERG